MHFEEVRSGEILKLPSLPAGVHIIIAGIGSNAVITSESPVWLVVKDQIGDHVKISLGKDSSLFLDDGIKIGKGLVVEILGDQAYVGSKHVVIPPDAQFTPAHSYQIK